MVGRKFRPRVSQLGRRKSRVRLAGSCGRCVRILAEFDGLAAWGYVVIVGRGTPRRSDACPGSIAGIRRHGVGQEEKEAGKSGAAETAAGDCPAYLCEGVEWATFHVLRSCR